MPPAGRLRRGQNPGRIQVPGCVLLVAASSPTYLPPYYPIMHYHIIAAVRIVPVPYTAAVLWYTAVELESDLPLQRFGMNQRPVSPKAGAGGTTRRQYEGNRELYGNCINILTNMIIRTYKYLFLRRGVCEEKWRTHYYCYWCSCVRIYLVAFKEEGRTCSPPYLVFLVLD